MTSAYSQGPWLVDGFPLHLHKPSEDQIDTATIWLTLPELPIELHDHSTLETAGNNLGKLVNLDI